MSSACVLIFKTHSFRFLHWSESHYWCFESTLRYETYVIVFTNWAKKVLVLSKINMAPCNCCCYWPYSMLTFCKLIPYSQLYNAFVLVQDNFSSKFCLHLVKPFCLHPPKTLRVLLIVVAAFISEALTEIVLLV